MAKTRRMFKAAHRFNVQFIRKKRARYPHVLLTATLVERPEIVDAAEPYCFVYVPLPNDKNYYWMFETEEEREEFKNKYAPGGCYEENSDG